MRSRCPLDRRARRFHGPRPSRGRLLGERFLQSRERLRAKRAFWFAAALRAHQHLHGSDRARAEIDVEIVHVRCRDDRSYRIGEQLE